jgi:hypothetical protein
VADADQPFRENVDVGQYDLIPSCAGPTYIRHGEKGDRTVTREAYTAEIAQTRQERPNLRFVVYDHSFEGDRAWFRFTLKFTDPKTGETRTRAGMQVYRSAIRNHLGEYRGKGFRLLER